MGEEVVAYFMPLPCHYQCNPQKTVGYMVEWSMLSVLPLNYNFIALLIILVLSILSTWLNHYTGSPSKSLNKYSHPTPSLKI
jgi:hypothetical protein